MHFTASDHSQIRIGENGTQKEKVRAERVPQEREKPKERGQVPHPRAPRSASASTKGNAATRSVVQSCLQSVLQEGPQWFELQGRKACPGHNGDTLTRALQRHRCKGTAQIFKEDSSGVVCFLRETEKEFSFIMAAKVVETIQCGNRG